MATAAYDLKLTEGEFSEKFRRAHGARVLCDAQNKILGSVSSDKIFDLNGKVIAELRSEEKTADENGKKRRIAEYVSVGHTFKLIGDVLYVTDGGVQRWVGKIMRNERSPAHIVLLSLLAALLITTVILVALLALPFGDRERPVIDIRDNNGTWEAQGPIAVFGSSVRPGSSGDYEFILRNPHNVAMEYSFYIKPGYEGGEIDHFPLQFRLKMNNVYMASDDWKSVEELSFDELVILQDSAQYFTLEWRWPFEAGSDKNDTLIGKDGGKISMELCLTAQAR